MQAFMTALVCMAFAGTAYAAGSHEHGHGHGHADFKVGQPATGMPDRVIVVSMHDTMKFVFSPEFTDLHDGEVIRFEVRNDGAIAHEFSIGNAEEQAGHAQMMREMPNMKHDDPNAVMLDPGQSASITWRFKGDDTVVFSCNIPGHFEAGMHHELAIGHVHQNG